MDFIPYWCRRSEGYLFYSEDPTTGRVTGRMEVQGEGELVFVIDHDSDVPLPETEVRAYLAISSK